GRGRRRLARILSGPPPATRGRGRWGSPPRISWFNPSKRAPRVVLFQQRRSPRRAPTLLLAPAGKRAQTGTTVPPRLPTTIASRDWRATTRTPARPNRPPDGPPSFPR